MCFELTPNLGSVRVPGTVARAHGGNHPEIRGVSGADVPESARVSVRRSTPDDRRAHDLRLCHRVVSAQHAQGEASEPQSEIKRKKQHGWDKPDRKRQHLVDSFGMSRPCLIVSAMIISACGLRRSVPGVSEHTFSRAHRGSEPDDDKFNLRKVLQHKVDADVITMLI